MRTSGNVANRDIIRGRVEEYLRSQNFKYTLDEEEQRILCSFNLKGKVRNVRMAIALDYDDSYIVVCFFPMNAVEESYGAVTRLLNYINYQSKFGNYEMDERDGEIRYRMTVDCEGTTLSTEMIDKSIRIPLSMIRKYGESLLAVVMGYKTFDEAKKMIDDEEEK